MDWIIGTARRWQIILAILLGVVSKLALSPADEASFSLGWDKLNHLSAFAALGFSAWLGFRRQPLRQAVSLVALLVYGAAIEVIQYFVPGRSSEWLDLLADALGLVIGALMASSLYRRYG